MSKIITKNKDAFFNFEIVEIFEAGIQLFGWEVKSIRAKKINIQNNFCYFKDNEFYVSNIHIDHYMNVAGDEDRLRKLLLKKNELNKIRTFLQIKGHSVIATTLKWSNTGFIKLEIGLAKGRSKIDKREYIKLRDDKKINKITGV